MTVRIEHWRSFFSALSDSWSLRPVILDSWRRSRLAGVDAAAPVEFHRVTEAELADRLRRRERLLAVAEEHLRWLSLGLSQVPHVAYVTDEDGIVLYSVGYERLQQDYRLTPGYDWSERRMGTNGAGTALVEDRPVAVVGPEHYAKVFRDCTCTAAPVHEADGNVIGAIDVSSAVGDATPERLVLVSYIAQVIERELQGGGASLPAPEAAAGPDVYAMSRTVRAAPVRRWSNVLWLAVALAAAAFLVRFALDPLLGDRLPYMLGLAAVAVATRLAGWRCGLATAVLSQLWGNFFFVSPRGRFVYDAPEVAGLVSYYAVSALVMYLLDRYSPGGAWLRSVQLKTQNGLQRGRAAAIVKAAAGGVPAPARAKPLRTRLGRLLAAAFLPLAVTSAVILWQQWQAQKAAVESGLADAAEAVVDAIDREIAAARARMETLAASELIDQGRWPAFHRYAREVVADRPGHLVAVTDRTGQLVLNTAVPYGTPLPNVWRLEEQHAEVEWNGRRLPVSSQGMTKDVFAHGRPVYSGLYYGVTIKRPAVALAVPAMREGRAVYALIFSFPPDALAELIAKHATSNELRLSIVDRNGTVVASSGNAASRQGDQVGPALMRLAESSPSGLLEATARDGTRVVGAYATSASTGWIVRAALPRDAAYAPVYESIVASLATLAAVIMVAMMLAGTLAGRVSASLARLARSARTLSRATADVSPSDIAEVEHLKTALVQGADAVRRQHEEHRARLEAERREAAATASEQHVRRVIDHLYAFVGVLDARGVLTEVNQAPLARAGLTRDEVVGRPFWTCHWWAYDPAVQRRVKDDCAKALAGEMIRYDAQARMAGGELITVDFQMAPIVEDGKTVYVIASGVDVTDRKAMQDELRQANASLAEADRRKDEFLAVLSHELRNPLGPLRTCAYMLAKLPPESDQAAQARAVIGRQTEQLSRLVDDLLDVSRIARDKFELRPGTADLAELLRAALEDQAAAPAARRITLQADIPPGPVRATVDAARIRQLVKNLLDNAVKFTPDGGTVGLSLAVHADRACIRVTDTGMGIDPALLPRVFDPFVQDTARERGHGGLGLGLALVKGIAEMHGGVAKAESAGPGQGATFTVGLPLHAAAESDAPAPLEGQAASQRRLNVLIVDDHHDGAASLAELVRLFGHHAEVVHDGPSALERAASHRPDVVLSDIGLPAMDGHAIAQALRRQPDAPYLIAVSGYGQADDARKARAAGFDRHIAKPVDPRELQRLLATAAALAGGAPSATPPAAAPDLSGPSVDDITA